MSSRNKAKRRHNDWVKTLHKRNIFKYVWHDNLDGYPIHKLSKGKVHCSCPLCAAKTKTNGYSASDRRKIEAGNDSLKEL